MLIFTYFILIGVFVGALILRKKLMDATVGAIHKGALTLNNRVEEWGNKQIAENPSSPMAQWRYGKLWKRAEARREIYQKLREEKYGQKKDGSRQEKGAFGDAGAPLPDNGKPDNGKNVGTTGNPLEDSTSQTKHTGGREPKAPTKDPEEKKSPGEEPTTETETETIQTPVEGLEQMPEKARESFGWRSAPDGQRGGQDEDVLEVFGPWDKIPQDARKPVNYSVVTEEGRKQKVYGSWEETPHGPVLRENYWSLERTPRAYQIMRDNAGNVFARKVGVDNAAQKQQQAGQQTAPQASQNIRPEGYSAPESPPVPQPSANQAATATRRRIPLRMAQAPGRPASGDFRNSPADTARGTRAKSHPTQRRERGPVDFGARYSPGTHPPEDTDEKTIRQPEFAKEEKTDVRTADPYIRAREETADPDRHNSDERKRH
ncbi:hypothetical protein Psch_03455 [Pelotomaculum schinkii]|uniref:Uncharacterized protein n=1 Tax=Pelotomaculum schinkii TaxID=78350 RepID=A0A4Y7R7J7_9FIRM|nr:hypothetical protein [Pelotomaculum schinkii]TEB04693.1 hypothetical protein Psch_03455 [Pelotomaculum schinkii]